MSKIVYLVTFVAMWVNIGNTFESTFPDVSYSYIMGFGAFTAVICFTGASAVEILFKGIIKRLDNV